MNTKYELDEKETKWYKGLLLNRVVALKDFSGVKNLQTLLIRLKVIKRRIMCVEG